MPAGSVCAGLLLHLLVVVLGSAELGTASHSSGGRCRYDSLFSFGDSFADTGNNPAVFAWYSFFDFDLVTFFGRPTGRNCDGRLVLDFLGTCARRRAAPS